jgi:hypothetical protein
MANSVAPVAPAKIPSVLPDDVDLVSHADRIKSDAAKDAAAYFNRQQMRTDYANELKEVHGVPEDEAQRLATKWLAAQG